MFWVIGIGAFLVLVTGIEAIMGRTFWSLPVTVIAATALLVVLAGHRSVPWWVWLIATVVIIASLARWACRAGVGWIAVGVLALVAIVAAGSFAVGFPSAATGVASSKPSPSPSASKKSNVALPKGTQNSLTVNPADILPGGTKCASDTFLDNSRTPVTAQNATDDKWSYSVTVPYVSSDPTVMMTEMSAENCGNPTVLDMNVQWLASLDVQGFKVGAANPWMGKFLAKAGDPGLRSSFLTNKTEGESKIFVTADYQSVAAMVNYLLTRFAVIGVGSWQSVSNWHLDGAGLVAGELPRVSLNPNQESLPALRLELTDKGVGCVFAGGFNTADKRWEEFPCVTPVTPATTTVPAPVAPAVPATTPGKPAKVTPHKVTPPVVKPPKVTPPPVTPPNTHKVGHFPAPGRDNTRDSGVGTKPVVPTVTTPQDAAPPWVDAAPHTPAAPAAAPAVPLTQALESGVGDNTRKSVNPFG